MKFVIALFHCYKNNKKKKIGSFWMISDALTLKGVLGTAQFQMIIINAKNMFNIHFALIFEIADC